jgi:RNA-directed DNA polymerase
MRSVITAQVSWLHLTSGSVPSITNLHVYRLWANVLLGCSPAVASLLTKISTFDRLLPQGAPTSPALANLFIWSIDGEIRDACAQLGLEYSTWIDDLAFSGDRARDVIQVVVVALKRNGLRLSHKKIKIMGGSESKLLTGTRFGSRSLRAPREMCDRARAGIHKLGCGLVPESEMAIYCRKLSALISHIKRLSPQDSVRLRRAISVQLSS